MSEIKMLNVELKSLLRSSIIISEYKQCFEELLFNSLDSGANIIEIFINIPESFIQIEDNGRGISYENMKYVAERYYTDKFVNQNDLFNHSIHGYRGEGLASIRDTCELLEIHTKKDRHSIIKVFQEGCLKFLKCYPNKDSLNGTKIKVSNLFFKMPVRKNCMNVIFEREEINKRLIAESIINYKVNLTLKNTSDSVLLSTLKIPKSLSKLERLHFLFGKKFSSTFDHISYKYKECSIRGFISVQEADTLSSTIIRFVFLNNKWIQNQKIYSQIDRWFKICKSQFSGIQDKNSGCVENYLNSYNTNSLLQLKDFITEKEHKISSKFIENISCKFVKTIKSTNILNNSSIKNQLSNNESLVDSRVNGYIGFHSLSNKSYNFNSSFILSLPNENEPSKKKLKLMGCHQDNFNNNISNPSALNFSNLNKCRINISLEFDVPILKDFLNIEFLRKNSMIVSKDISFTKTMAKNLKVIGQIDNKFIACITPIGNQLNGQEPMLVFLDQHGVHERIRLEKLINENLNDSNDVISAFCVTEIKMEVSSENLRIMMAFQNSINKHGIYFRSCQSCINQIVLEKLPVCFIKKNNKANSSFNMNISNYIDSILQKLKSGCKTLFPSQILYKHLASMACHGAIKFGDKLSMQQCMQLVKDISECNLPFQCAHGRPTIIPIVNIVQLNNMYAIKTSNKLNISKFRKAMKLKQL